MKTKLKMKFAQNGLSVKTQSCRIFSILIFILLSFSFLSSFPVDVKWKVQTTQTSTAPIIGEDYLFSISDAGNVVAFNRFTMSRVWNLDLGKSVKYQSSFISNILFVPAENILFAVSKDGRIVGNISFNSTISTPVIEVGSNLVVATRDGNVYIISQPGNTFTNKNIIKTNKLDGEIDSSFALSGNKIFVATVSGKIYSIDPTASLVLLYDLGYSVWRSKLVVTNNTIYVPAEHSLYAVDMQGKLLMVKRIADGNLNSMATDGERLYVGSDDGYLYSLDLEGNIIWKFKTNNSIKSIPVILQDSILISSRDNNIYSINKKGNLKWNISVSDWPSDIVEEKGIFYFTTYDGAVYAVSLLSCQITNPEVSSTILPIVAVAGDAYSENGVKSVQVRTLPGEWQSVSLHGDGNNLSWSGNIQITGFTEGEVSLQCRVIDKYDNQEQPPYFTSTYNFVFSEEKLPKINVSYPLQVNVNQPIIIKFFTTEGAILTDVNVKIGGETFKVTDKSGQFTYTPTKEGDLTIYIEKSGYQQRQIQIKVTKPLIQPIYVVIIFIVAVAIVIYSSIRKGTWK
ncbi:MAG: PQQ-binding-like beta-propeller repeat protein [Candidatus Micrarchaeia archaeon]